MLKVLEEIVRKGYQGWVSFELFDRGLEGAGAGVPAGHAERAGRSWGRVVREMMGWGIGDGEEEVQK